jgi:hypothetical protein
MNKQLNDLQRQKVEEILGELPFFYCNAQVRFEPGRTESGLNVVVPAGQTPWDYCALGLAVASVARGSGTGAYMNTRDDLGNEADAFVIELD